MASQDRKPKHETISSKDHLPAHSGQGADSIRQRAEDILRQKIATSPGKFEDLSSEEIRLRLHELQVHQIELEMQNDKLRRAQVELEATRTRYFELYDLAPTGYCALSESELIHETNLTAATLPGGTKADLLRQPISRYIFQKDQDSYYLCSKLAEEALQKIHRQNQDILDSITDAFISLSEDMVINYFNAAAEKILNRKRIEVIGRNMFDVFPEWKGTIFEDNCTEAIWPQAPKLFDFKPNRASCLAWYGVRIYPALDGIMISLREVTERKKMEAEEEKRLTISRQLQKAESLERMAGAISHLFNNHLQVALGNLEMALDNLPDAAISREYLIGAIKANRRSSDVSGLLLTYLGQNISELEPLNLSEISRQSLQGLETAIPSGIIIDSNFMLPGPAVRANRSKLQQVLTILITNAWEAIRDTDGKVTVVVNTVSASTIPNSHVSNIEWVSTFKMFACLEVTDTGCGMSKEDMVKIFDPFYTNKFTGRGLGLAVAMSLVRGWGGMIYVNSAANKGSCFKVYLPLALDVFPLQADLLTNQEVSQAEGTVLLVDDDPMFCMVAKAMIEHIGFTVFVAEGGHEAVALFQKHHNSIDCLLTDLSMPDMDGWETLAVLRKVKPDLPAILVSGYDKAQAMSGDHKELPQAFLHKPYTKDELKNVLNRILANAAIDAVEA